MEENEEFDKDSAKSMKLDLEMMKSLKEGSKAGSWESQHSQGLFGVKRLEPTGGR